MYGAEVFDGETARFEVELSEDDVHGQWKLNGEVLSPSAVCLINISGYFLFLWFDLLSFISLTVLHIETAPSNQGYCELKYEQFDVNVAHK